jgi:hypothetical protein
MGTLVGRGVLYTHGADLQPHPRRQQSSRGRNIVRET